MLIYLSCGMFRGCEQHQDWIKQAIFYGETCNYLSVCSLSFTSAVTWLLKTSLSKLCHGTSTVHLQDIAGGLRQLCLILVSQRFIWWKAKSLSTMRTMNSPELKLSMRWLFFSSPRLAEALKLVIWLPLAFFYSFEAPWVWSIRTAH